MSLDPIDVAERTAQNDSQEEWIRAMNATEDQRLERLTHARAFYESENECIHYSACELPRLARRLAYARSHPTVTPDLVRTWTDELKRATEQAEEYRIAREREYDAEAKVDCLLAMWTEYRSNMSTWTDRYRGRTEMRDQLDVAEEAYYAIVYQSDAQHASTHYWASVHARRRAKKSITRACASGDSTQAKKQKL